MRSARERVRIGYLGSWSSSRVCENGVSQISGGGKGLTVGG